MNRKIIIIGLLVIVVCIIYCRSGNFTDMRNVAFSEFDTYMSEYNIEPSLFKGPFLDITNRKRLNFYWQYFDKETNDTLSLIVTVPPIFSSFRASIGGVGGKPETWKKLADTKKKNK